MKFYGKNLTDEMVMDEALAEVKVPGANDVRGNISLISKTTSGVTVAWTSSDESVVSTAVKTNAGYDDTPAGVVTRPADADASVTLTATLTHKALTETKTFNLTVKKAVAPVNNANRYLFVHFTGDEKTPDAEQVYFAASKNGLTFSDLNRGQPVMRSAIGEKGVRDMHLIRSPEGDRFYLIATDLSIHLRANGWGANNNATATGSNKIVVWESDDLVNWSAPRLALVAAQGAGMAWAPESYYDEKTGEYIVFWSSALGGRTQVYYAKTRDFYTFTEAKPFVESTDVIDATVTESGNYYYRASKFGGNNASNIFLQRVPKADGLLGTWSNYISLAGTRGGNSTVPSSPSAISYYASGGAGLEGPEFYKLANGDTILMADRYTNGTGYVPFLLQDLDDTKTWSVMPGANFNYGIVKKRHGNILPITEAEYARVLANWPEGLASGVTVEPVTAQAIVGKTTTITAIVAPADTFNKTVRWSSSNPDVATVNANGIVTAKKAGLVDITAMTVDGDYSAISLVTVVDFANIYNLNMTVTLTENNITNGTLSEYGTTATIWKELTDALAAGKAIVANYQDYTQPQANAAEQRIKDAAAAARAAGNQINTAELEVYVAMAQAYMAEKDLYVPSAIAALKPALDAAEAVLATRETQAKVDEAADNLLAAIELVYEKGDLLPLNAMATFVTSLDENAYTTDSWAALLKALETANKVLAMGEEASIYHVEFAYDAMMSAITGLKDKVVLNYYGIDTTIAKGDNIAANADKYIASSITGLNAALTAAKNVRTNATTQKALDDATVALATVIAKARLKANLGGLSGLQAKVESLDLSLYTTESAGLVRSLSAKGAGLTEEATQQEVDQTVYELSAAINALEEKPAGVIGKATTPKSDNAVKSPAKTTADKSASGGSKSATSKSNTKNATKNSSANAATFGSTSGTSGNTASASGASGTATSLPTVSTTGTETAGGATAAANAPVVDTGNAAATDPVVIAADKVPAAAQTIPAEDAGGIGGLPLSVVISILLAAVFAAGFLGFYFVRRRRAKQGTEK
jgi:hypothetical protein